MRTVDDYEAIRRAYFLDGLSIREIAQTLHHGRRVVRRGDYKRGMTNTTVVIVNYNTRDLLRSCLNSVQAEAPDEIIVVDNASTDGSTEMVKAEFPSVQLIRNETNMGYGAAANRAVARCAAPYFLLLNTDTILLPGAVKELCCFLNQNPQVAIVGPRLLDPYGALQPSCFPFPTPLDILMDVSHLSRLVRFIPSLKDRYLRSWNHLHSRRVPWVVGAALAIRREAFVAIGGFDETFFMYYEEVDLCYRLLQSGWQVHHLPSAEIIHIGGGSTEKHRADMTVQFYASLAHFYRRHYSLVRFLELFLLIEFIALARLIRDRLLLQLDQDIRKRKSLSKNIVAWYRLLYGDWRKHRPEEQGITCYPNT